LPAQPIYEKRCRTLEWLISRIFTFSARDIPTAKSPCVTPEPHEHIRSLVALAQPFASDYPTPETAQQLQDELLFKGGLQSYLWALPAINVWGMKQASEARFAAAYNVLPVWKQRLSAKTLMSTPNSDASTLPSLVRSTPSS
jgi:hypothetical protein